jgi:hypothetical protein
MRDCAVVLDGDAFLIGFREEAFNEVAQERPVSFACGSMNE